MRHEINVSGFELRSEDSSLDPVTVYFQNFTPGKGRVTLECYCISWSCYFGAMGNGQTMEDFFREASEEYLTHKLSRQRDLERDKKHLRKMVNVVKAELVAAGAHTREEGT